MLKRFKTSIAYPIILGYAILVIISLGANFFSIRTINQTKNIDNKISEVYLPLFFELKEFGLMVEKSGKLTGNWIYQPNLDEKKVLSGILSTDYAKLKKSLEETAQKLENKQDVDDLNLLIADFDKVIEQEKGVTGLLNADSCYHNDVLLEKCIGLQEKGIVPAIKDLIARTKVEVEKNDIQAMMTDARATKDKSYGNLFVLLIGSMLVLVVVSIGTSYISVTSITKPLNKSVEVIANLGNGKIISLEDLNDREDEIGKIISALKRLVVGLKEKIEFATEIGKGNYEQDFNLLSKEDGLGSALIDMRNSLVNNAKEEQKRNWATQGLAKFADILRTNDQGVAALGDSIISNLVKYLDANQGGLFVINDAEESDVHLELIACYAWNKKKYLKMRVDSGEGLVGQAWQENDTLLITEVPQNYVKITSGLGEANPNCFLIVPLTVNDVTYGVVEIASFKTFETYQIDFVKKLAESIASTLSTTKINERTKILLDQSQMQTEQKRAQEEEMRQNMEEMQATQEEMERKDRDTMQLLEQARQQEEELKQNMEEMKVIHEEMNRKEIHMLRTIEEKTKEARERDEVFSLNTILSESDATGKITYANDKLAQVSKYSNQEMMGKAHSLFRHPDMPKELFKLMWDTIQSGKVFAGIVKNKAKDGTPYWVDATIMPVSDDKGKIVKYIGARYHLTDEVYALKKYNEQMQKLGLPGLEK